MSCVVPERCHQSTDDALAFCNPLGIYIFRCEKYIDPRGYFFESWSKRDFEKAGIQTDFVQDNISFSKKNVVRGLHFQKKCPQAKLITVVRGSIYDVALDIRKFSSTFGQAHEILLSADANTQLYIPQGFAHGFAVISDEAVVMYKVSTPCHPEDEAGIRWDDPELAINWPVKNAIVSFKDESWPFWRDVRETL